MLNMLYLQSIIGQVLKKSQVEEDMNSHLHRVKGKNISNRMKEAKQKSSQQSHSDKIISKKEPVR